MRATEEEWQHSSTARGLRTRLRGPTSAERHLMRFVVRAGPGRAGRWSVQSLAQKAAIRHRRSELRTTRNPMLLFEFVGSLLGFTKRPERILAVRHELFPHRRDAPATEQLVQLLLRTALPVRRDLDKFKWHQSLSSVFKKKSPAGATPLQPLWFLHFILHPS
jgi:hypothetical protein